MTNRFMPSPGAPALELRKICDQLTRSVAVIGRHGIADFGAIDAASAGFLLALVNWEIAHDVRRWPWVLGAYGDVLSAWREAARCVVVDGDEWKYA